ncbi:MAG: hypothetical protein MJE68_27280 [Proteobacteria bacterium]|nr:hypothetical protein [Pseudomonadota bacterium]
MQQTSFSVKDSPYSKHFSSVAAHTRRERERERREKVEPTLKISSQDSR